MIKAGIIGATGYAGKNCETFLDIKMWRLNGMDQEVI